MLFTVQIILPVGDIYVDDAGLQEFPVQVSACGQKPPLVVGQTVRHKQHIVLLRCLTEGLPELRLLVLDRCQDERRRVQTQTLRALQAGAKMGANEHSTQKIMTFNCLINYSL